MNPAPPVRVYLGDSLPDILGQGKPSAPTLNPDVLSAIQTEAGHVADTLRYELEAVKTEGNMVSGQTLRSQPDLYKSISIVGPYLSPQEIRNAVINDAKAIQGQAQRLRAEGFSRGPCRWQSRSIMPRLAAGSAGATGAPNPNDGETT